VSYRARTFATFLSGLLCIGLSYAGPFLGFSDTSITGASGLRGMNLACQSKFGADSRLCSSQEILASPSLPAQSEWGWVHPTFASHSSDPDKIADVSGVEHGTNLACGGWASSSPTVAGLAVNGNNFSFSGHSCDSQNHVACCLASRCFTFTTNPFPP